jgi:hypothetical protein
MSRGGVIKIFLLVRTKIDTTTNLDSVLDLVVLRVGGIVLVRHAPLVHDVVGTRLDDAEHLSVDGPAVRGCRIISERSDRMRH